MTTEHEADTVDLGADSDNRKDELDHLAALRAIGAKWVSWDSSGDIQAVEFFEMSEDERVDAAIAQMSDGDRRMYDAMTREERTEAVRKHRESILYHSS